MPIKQTHIYRGHAIVHQVFASDQTEETIERFVVGRPGKNNNLCDKPTLMEAKATVDAMVEAGSLGFAVRSA
jgi:hypothetical protein